MRASAAQDALAAAGQAGSAPDSARTGISAAGYSGTPLARKLGLRAGLRIFVENPPADWPQLVAPLATTLVECARFDAHVEWAQVFHREKAALAGALQSMRALMAADCVIWVSWPKQASKVPTDITEDRIRELALPLGLVDIKVCAVDAIWSGLKLMLRRELRG